VIRVATRTASGADRGANADQRHRADSAVRGSAVAAASPSVATPRRPSIGHECQVERRWKNQAHNGGVGQHGERRGKRSNATASPPHRRHHGASGQPSGWRTAAIWRRMAAIIHQPPSTARRRWQNEDDDESPAKGRLQPHSARPASGAHPRQHGRKSGARAPSAEPSAIFAQPSGRSEVEVRPGPLVAKHSVWPG
jgi:hypothetical protein